ncbi:baeRF10 domain-containing protein [Mycobacterium sp. ZZG]
MITAETVNRIVGFRGNGMPVISLYAAVPYEPEDRVTVVRSKLDSLLHEIQPMAQDHQLGHDAMLSVRADMERFTEAVEKHDRWSPGSVAMFSCSGRDFFEEVQLPRSVHDRIVVDETPWVRPMLAVLDEYHRCCVAVVDRKAARIWELFQDEMSEVGTRRVDADPGRNQDKAEELTKRHYLEVVTMLDKMHRDGAFELLIVGGHHAELPRFLDYLTHELRPTLAGTFTVDDDARTAFGDVKRQAAAVLQRYERDEEERMVAETVEKAAAGGLAVLGLPGCLWAGTVAAVDELLVQDGTVTPGVICDHDQWMALSGETCPLCGRPVRRTPDIVDELAQVVMNESGSIEHVCADTVLKQHLTAASLRFPLPPAPG